jgi:hypothetical protein
MGVCDGLTVTGNDGFQSACSADDSLCELGGVVAVVQHAPRLIAEQVRMLGNDGQTRHMHAVGEHVERRQLGGVDQVLCQDRGASSGSAALSRFSRHVNYRFLAAGRLGAGGGGWNTSK